jgi:hypothetical protein
MNIMRQTIVEYTHTHTPRICAHTTSVKPKKKNDYKRLLQGRCLREKIQHFFFFISPLAYLLYHADLVRSSYTDQSINVRVQEKQVNTVVVQTVRSVDCERHENSCLVFDTRRRNP